MKSVADLAWRVLASRALSTVLGLLLAATAVVAAIVPQGVEALALAREGHATTLHTLAAWELTDIYASDLFRALMALIGGNLAAVVLTAAMARRAAPALDPPAAPAVVHDVIAPRPEHALELTRAVLSSHLGLPVLERAEGAKSKLVFDVGRRAHLGPALAHAGLMFLVLGAGLYAARSGQGVPRVVVDITDLGNGNTGRFDIVAGEPFTFFQRTERYTLRDYVPSREGLGPAVRFERDSQDGGREVWVYARAPRGFDARHRKGEVAFEPVWMGWSPLPGRGLSGSPLAALMLGGLTLVGLGIGTTRRARGRVWTEVDGDRIVIRGQGDEALGVVVRGARARLEGALADAL